MNSLEALYKTLARELGARPGPLGWNVAAYLDGDPQGCHGRDSLDAESLELLEKTAEGVLIKNPEATVLYAVKINGTIHKLVVSLEPDAMEQEAQQQPALKQAWRCYRAEVAAAKLLYDVQLLMTEAGLTVPIETLKWILRQEPPMGPAA